MPAPRCPPASTATRTTPSAPPPPHPPPATPRPRPAPPPATPPLRPTPPAPRARSRLGLPLHALACLLGVSTDPISPAIKHTSDLLAQHDIALPARTASLPTLDDLHRYAETAGVTIPGLHESTDPHE